ncbi:MAG: SIMPL domain-containing protein [Propionibacteriaceae bacterium]|nr:SIMPL domain-containing protein [Propionibacteriaceae bacterium]
MQIAVVGHAHASFPPERATLRMRLGVEGSDKQAALEHTTFLVQGFSTVVDQLKDMAPSPITWAAVAPIGTRSWRPWSQDGAVLPTRHSAYCVVQLKFHDFHALARFIDQWGGRSGVTVEAVEWTLTEQRREAEETNVLARAVVQAHARATTMARAAGEQGVRFLELADRGLLNDRPYSEDSMAYGTAMRSVAMDDSEGITIAPEDVELDVTVHARFSTD